jgi:MFS family permease
MFPRAIWILFAGTFINRFGSFVVVFLILYLTKNGYSPAEAGLAAAAYGVGGMFASIIGGHLADQIGRRNAMVLSMFSAAVAILLLERAETYPSIVGLTALVGLTAELYRPASSALLNDLIKPEDRVPAFAAYRLAINLGAAAGPVVGGLLATRSFSYLFWGDALTCVLFGIIALVALPQGLRTTLAHEKQAPWSSLLRDIPFMRFLMASTLIGIVYAQMNTGFALQVSARGFSDAIYGALVALNGLIVLVLELPIAGVTRFRARRPVIALGMALITVGFALTGAAPSVLLLAGTVLIWTLGEIISAPVASAYVSDIAPEHLRGRYHGAWSFTFALGMVIGPAVGGQLFSWSPPLLWGACAVVGFVATMLLLIGRDTQPAASAATS